MTPVDRRILDETLDDLRRIRARFNDEAISKILLDTARKLSPGSCHEVEDYLRAHNLPVPTSTTPLASSG